MNEIKLKDEIMWYYKSGSVIGYVNDEFDFIDIMRNVRGVRNINKKSLM